MPLLEVENAMVFYENALALNDLSLRVDPGEIVGVIGPNSAGKTTLMNTVSGLIVERATQERRRGGERCARGIGGSSGSGMRTRRLNSSGRAKWGRAS